MMIIIKMQIYNVQTYPAMAAQGDRLVEVTQLQFWGHRVSTALLAYGCNALFKSFSALALVVL